MEQNLNAHLTRPGTLVNSSCALWNMNSNTYSTDEIPLLLIDQKQRNSNEQSPFSSQVVPWTAGKTDIIASGAEGVSRIKDLWVICLWWIWDDGIWTVQAGSESRIILWLLIAIVPEHREPSSEELIALLLESIGGRQSSLQVHSISSLIPSYRNRTRGKATESCQLWEQNILNSSIIIFQS